MKTNLILRVFRKVCSILNRFNIRWITTIYFNFRMLPFKQAIHLPIVFKGKVEFWTLSGKVVLDAPARFGMIQFGGKRDGFCPLGIPIHLSLDKRSKLIFKGKSFISPGCNLRILGNLVLGNNTFLGSQTLIGCNNYIEVGFNSRVTFCCVVIDTNFHFIEIDGKVAPKEGTVIIGDNCWIGNHSSVMKGAVIPNDSIVSSRSLINKDFSAEGENLFLAGTPAKFKRKGLKRVFEVQLEVKIDNYFDANPEADFYYLDECDKKS